VGDADAVTEVMDRDDPLDVYRRALDRLVDDAIDLALASDDLEDALVDAVIAQLPLAVAERIEREHYSNDVAEAIFEALQEASSVLYEIADHHDLRDLRDEPEEVK